MSTDEQAKLDSYTASGATGEVTVASSSEPAQRPAWAPDSDAALLHECRNCGGHVSSDFARVMGDNNDQVWHCQYCVSGAEIQAGAAANPDYEHYHDRGVPKR